MTRDLAQQKAWTSSRRGGMAFFGAWNLGCALFMHFVFGPYWPVLMSFGVMGAACLIVAPFFPERREGPGTVPTGGRSRHRSV